LQWLPPHLEAAELLPSAHLGRPWGSLETLSRCPPPLLRLPKAQPNQPPVLGDPGVGTYGSVTRKARRRVVKYGSSLPLLSAPSLSHVTLEPPPSPRGLERGAHEPESPRERRADSVRVRFVKTRAGTHSHICTHFAQLLARSLQALASPQGREKGEQPQPPRGKSALDVPGNEMGLRRLTPTQAHRRVFPACPEDIRTAATIYDNTIILYYVSTP
ncbi:uncharacterized protein LOC112541672, partial [Python bivittatus]|uniref:Uncharacterized protein LOC112541672 n=1 Tax=Python bivittatus TaxID=176946 RepID=A0A9F5J1T3_PYTBI